MQPTQTDIPYTFSSPQTDDQHAHIAFSSRFNDHLVNWNAHIMTIDWYAKNSMPDQTDTCKQFIEITKNGQNQTYKLSVCLATSKINHPTILKTIIMIKNYKRLRIGKHEYGESVRVRPES